MPSVGGTHHINLGGHYYMVKPGSYQKRVAPQFGARFSTGDPDYNNLSFWQHWVQNCFVGGMDAELWADDAMFDDGIGVNTTEHEKVTLSRDLKRGSGANWTLGGSTNVDAWKAVIFNESLYVLGCTTAGNNSKLYKYDPPTDGWVVQSAFSDTQAFSIAVFDGKLFIGGRTLAGGPKLIYSSGSISSWTIVTSPPGVGATAAVTAMRAFQQKLYVGYSGQIWRMKDDQTWDGNTVFYKVNAASESNHISAMEVHLGFLYMISNNGHVHRTDGNTTFDIWNWDGQTVGIAIKSFDGRLFVLTYEYTDTASVGQGVLYQMSGSAMTQLKRWGSDDKATRIGNMIVYDRKLWYGASNLLGMASDRDGFGVACYDPIEDAHSVFATSGDTSTFGTGSLPYVNFIVDDQIFFHGYLFVFVRGHGAVKTPVRYRDILRGVASFDTTGPSNRGHLTTSTYDAGTPGIRKMWRKVVLDVAVPANTHVMAEYTIDGTTWVPIGTVTGPQTRARHEFYLENILATAFKMRINLGSTSAAATPTFHGFAVSYIPVPEPNWLWTFTILLPEKIELLDETVETIDTESELAFLSALYRTKQMVNFVDVDGTSWAAAGNAGVLLYDCTFWQPDLTQPLEGEVQVTLLEAVESF